MTIISDIYVELNGIPLDTHAWRVIERGYDELLNTPSIRGRDLTMPGATGRRPYPRIIDATTVSLPLLVTGSFDEDGAPIADPLVGLMEHRDYLRDNLGLAEGGDGTVPMVFHRRTLADLAGDVTFLGLNDWTTLGGTDALVRIDLSIPAGELAPVGS